MNKDELVTINDLDETSRKLMNCLIEEFKAIRLKIEEQNKPYIYWAENLSMKQAMEYTGRSKTCILAWVKDELLTPYQLGGSTSIYYSKTELDSIKPRWEAQKRNKTLKRVI